MGDHEGTLLGLHLELMLNQLAEQETLYRSIHGGLPGWRGQKLGGLLVACDVARAAVKEATKGEPTVSGMLRSCRHLHKAVAAVGEEVWRQLQQLAAVAASEERRAARRGVRV